MQSATRGMRSLLEGHELGFEMGDDLNLQRHLLILPMFLRQSLPQLADELALLRGYLVVRKLWFGPQMRHGMSNGNGRPHKDKDGLI